MLIPKSERIDLEEEEEEEEVKETQVSFPDFAKIWMKSTSRNVKRQFSTS